MKPILYAPTETIFNHNGIGILTDAISCTVTEECNGPFELTLEYPMSGIHYAQITQRSLIKAKPSAVDNPQLFRIYAISRPMKGIVTVNAQHISYDMSGIPVLPFSASGIVLALEGLTANAAIDCPFTFWTDKTTQGEYTITIPHSMRSCMGGNKESILYQYGGEYAYDNYLIRLYNHRGMNRGVSIRYGKNLTDLTQEENCASVYTAVLPYWLGQDGELVQLSERIVNAPGTYDFSHVKTQDFSSDFDTAPTQEQLRLRTEQYIADNRIGVPTVSLTVAYESLEKYADYENLQQLERVLLCDTVNVIFPKLNVNATAKAIKVVYDVLSEKVKSVTLGSVRANIADTIVSQNQQIAEKPSLSQMQSAVNRTTAAILGTTGGAVRLLDTDGDKLPDTLYIADNPDPAKAVKVWRWNYEGWGASKNGYNGPFVMGATFDAGIVADFITSGTFDANLIKAGVLQSADGNFRFNLATGEIFIGGYATTEDRDSLAAGISGNAADIGSLRTEMAKIDLQSGKLALQLQSILDNGVDKVTTTTGYTFDADGLHIQKSGYEIENRLDHTGMYVTRSGETMLQANADGVIATDVKVRNYLIIGDHARFENYNNGTDEKRTACFWLP